jgi:hypothetical protein
MIIEFSTLHGLASLSATCHKLYDILFPVLMCKASKLQRPGVTCVLHWASQRGCIRVVKGLLGAGVTIDILDQTGSSALMYASTSGHLDISEYLLAQGASWDINSRGETAVTKAASCDHPDILNTLFRHGAFLDSQYWWTLLDAASRGSLEVARILLENGVDANFQLTNQSTRAPARYLTRYIGQTSVHVATINGHPSLIALLAEHGANLGAADRYGHTALDHFIPFWPHLSSVQDRCLHELCGRSWWRATWWKSCQLFPFIFRKCFRILLWALLACCYYGSCCCLDGDCS